MLIYSMAAFFKGYGKSGKDMVYDWKVESLAADGWYIKAWDRPILIRGYQLTKLKGRKHDWFMIGNSFTPDACGFMGPNETTLQIWYPIGFYQDLGNGYIDIHGHGPGYQELALVIYYGR